MHLINTNHQTFEPSKVDKICADLQTGDLDWTYKVKHDPKGTGMSLIQIWDEDNEYIGYF